MKHERLKKILKYSRANSEVTSSQIKQFCSFTGIDHDNDVLNILQIVRSSLYKKGYWVFEMPFSDNEIGALCYRGDGLGYVVINTSLPKVNANFAVAHEVFHVFFQENSTIYKVEFTDENYYEHEEEYAANLFAGVLLMPEVSFRRMYAKFFGDSKGDILHTIIRLMAYYEVPYMSVLIRCLELKLIEKGIDVTRLLSVDRKDLRTNFVDLWLDESILNATNRDDYPHVEAIVKEFGRQYIVDQYINEKTLNAVLLNMKMIHNKLSGE